MLRKCDDGDRKEVLKFLKKRPSLNSFFIGDLENFSLDEDFIDLYISEKNGTINSVLLRYYKYYNISGGPDLDAEGVAEVLKNDSSALSLAGPEAVIDVLSDFISFKGIRRSTLAELTMDTFSDVETIHVTQKAEIGDLDELFSFQQSIDEFNIGMQEKASFGMEVKTGTGRMYFIRKDGKIVSSATITAENSLNGMIIGVATAPGYRNMGCASACVAGLCREMTAAGKSVVLFYSNPNAGRLYKKLGFRDRERRASAFLKEF